MSILEKMRSKALVAMAVAASLLATQFAWAQTEAVKAATHFNIPAGDLAAALKTFGEQSNTDVLFDPKLTASKRTPGLAGKHASDEGLRILLEGANLKFRMLDGKTVLIESARDIRISRVERGFVADGADTARVENESSGVSSAGAESGQAVPEMLVKGSRTLNTDIRRTEDDAQPYVVFDREQIRQSMSANLEEFLRTRLPMNTTQGASVQRSGINIFGNQSSINLRGLGSGQTLILVDGRRLPSVNSGGGGFMQPDINGVALDSIERIEILPSTASGIYGGGATGGVINIITRRDFSGFDVNAAYDNSFDSDVGNRQIGMTGGFSLEGGATRVTVSARHSASNPLLVKDRDFAVRGRALQFANNPNAFYATGTPPFGRTTNIRSRDGSSLQLKPQYGGTQLGFNRTFVPEGYGGLAVDGAASLVANAGQYNLDLPDDLNGGGQSLLGNPTVQSAALGLRREFGARVEAFLDLSWFENRSRSYYAAMFSSTRVPVSAPGNPFTTDLTVRFPSPGYSQFVDAESQSLRATAGVIARLPGGWSAALDHAWGRSGTRASLTFPSHGDPDGFGPGDHILDDLDSGELNVLRDLNLLPLDLSPYALPAPNYFFGPARTVLNQTSVRLSGPVLTLPAGPLTLSAFLERRKEEARDNFEDQIDDFGFSFVGYAPGSEQRMDSYSLEARVPVVRSLELQASVRRDEYVTRAPSPTYWYLDSRSGPFPPLTFSTNGVQASTYTLGLRYTPTEDLILRASVGTGLLPPGISQIVAGAPFVGSLTLADPRRGGLPAQLGPLNLVNAGNPDLVPEDSRSWSAGAVFTPRLLPGVRLSLDYTRIEKTNEIANLSFQLLLDLEDLFPDRVQRLALTAEDIQNNYTGGVVTGLDISAANMAASRLEAYDLQADYTLGTERMGDWEFFTVLTWQPHFERQAAPNAPFVDNVGFNNGILEWRGNGGVVWTRDAWAFGWNMQYYHSYRVYTATAAPATINSQVLSQGSATVPHQAYHDLFARYRFTGGRGLGVFENAEVAVGVQNVLDREPPILATTGATGGYSTYGDPRLRRYSISLRKSF